MKKITAFIGSARKRTTYKAVQEFEKYLRQYNDEIDFEYVFLSDFNLEFCRGCKLCFDKGEEFCPLKDDQKELLDKMEHSDGIIFASPSYAFQVSAQMKNFIDRISYIFHRPRFFGKAFLVIVTQGVPGIKDVLKYLESTGANLGFNVVKGCSLWTLEPMTENQQKKASQKIKKASERFNKELMRQTMPIPSLFRLMLFRMTRTGIQYSGVRYYDYEYYREKGWFESDYYYDVPLGFFKNQAGHLFDLIGKQMAKRR